MRLHSGNQTNRGQQTIHARAAYRTTRTLVMYGQEVDDTLRDWSPLALTL